MKKLVFLFSILLIVGNLQAQLAGHDKFIEKPDYAMKQLKNVYAFYNDTALYVLSYEEKYSEPFDPDIPAYPKNRITRNMYLFRQTENGWVVACDKAIQTDYYDKNSYTSYQKQPNDGGSISTSSDGTVTIILVNYIMPDLNDTQSRFKYTLKTIVLKPKGDGTYIVSNV